MISKESLLLVKINTNNEVLMAGTPLDSSTFTDISNGPTANLTKELGWWEEKYAGGHRLGNDEYLVVLKPVAIIQRRDAKPSKLPPNVTIL